MSRKVSTGYLTPQGSAKKKPNQLKRADSHKDLTDNLFEKLLNDPEKRKIVLEIINANKDAIEEYKKKEKKKEQRQQCESPIALYRRRALEKMKENGSEGSPRSSSRMSNCSSVGSPSPSPVPFNKLLDGVVAYVEVKSHNEDRSGGVKAVLKTMGATVKNKLTKEVTHCIYKDGSYNTYQTAKLLKIHMVSILWIEAVKNNNTRVPEKDFPAFGTEAFESNTSTLCSQWHKEYEEMVREEINQSIISGTPLPTTESLLKKKPILNSSISSESFTKSTNLENNVSSDEDDDLFINGTKVQKQRSQIDLFLDSPQNKLTKSDYAPQDMEITLDKTPSQNKTKKDIVDMDLTKNIAFASPNFITMRKKRSSIKSNITIGNNENDSTGTTMSSLRLSSEKRISDVSSNKTQMSDLKLSSSRRSENKNLSNDKNTSNQSRQSSMGVLKLSTDKASNLSSDSSEINFKTTVTTPRTNRISPNSDNSSIMTDDFSNASSKSSFSVNGNEINNLIKSLRSSDPSKDSSLDTSISSNKRSLSVSTNKASNITKETNTNNTASPKKKNFNSEKENVQPTENLKKNIDRNKSKPSRKSKVLQDEEKANNEKDKDQNRSVSSSRKRKTLNSEDLVKNKDELERRRKSRRVSKLIVETSESEREETPNKPKRKTDSKKTKSSSEESDGSAKKKKLYDPDDSINISLVADDSEREQRKIEKKIDGPSSVKPVNLFATPKKVVEPNEDVFVTPVIIPAKGKNKSGTKKKTIQKQINSDDDEQASLLEEILDEKKKKTEVPLSTPKGKGKVSENLTRKAKTCEQPEKHLRKSTRITQPPKRFVEYYSETDDDFPIRQIKRRSTLDFQSISQMNKAKKSKPDSLPTIVCTKFHRTEYADFCEIVKKIEGFVVEDEVGPRTTHLVAGEPKRTINMLRGIARGCWILKKEWLFRSVELGKWAPEADFEVTEFSPAVQECRIQRQAFGHKFTTDIFKNCDPLYVSKSSVPRCSDLRELVSLCKGKIVKNPDLATFIVGEYMQGEQFNCVKETWILDSVMLNKLMDYKRYLINRRVSIVV